MQHPAALGHMEGSANRQPITYLFNYRQLTGSTLSDFDACACTIFCQDKRSRCRNLALGRGLCGRRDALVIEGVGRFQLVPRRELDFIQSRRLPGVFGSHRPIVRFLWIKVWVGLWHLCVDLVAPAVRSSLILVARSGCATARSCDSLISFARSYSSTWLSSRNSISLYGPSRTAEPGELEICMYVGVCQNRGDPPTRQPTRN